MSMLKTIRDTNRLAEILRVLARHGFGALLQEAKLSVRDLIGATPPEPDESTNKLTIAERLRLACENLGPTFIKVLVIEINFCYATTHRATSCGFSRLH